MMGLDTPETCTDWRNIPKISCASSCFFLHDYIEMRGQQNIKFDETSVSLQSWEFSSLVRRLLVEFEK